MTQDKTIRIGGASGFWGESDLATPQFLAEGGLDYIVFDYLAEITMSIMARARAKDPAMGYAPDFVSSVLRPNLAEIARQGIKIISNAGGVNPAACATAVRKLVSDLGLDLKVATILGDDLLQQRMDFANADVVEMFSGDPFPKPDSVVSINAYLGAFPIADALDQGADIVITGRCVDSAVTLGACIHAFGWTPDNHDKLAAASLAGHIIECGPQATGGNFTDWEEVATSLHKIGYPIAEIATDGSFVITKPAGTGGAVTVGTVGEQMLYEIGDPQAYLLPDVVCDFSSVTLEQIATDRVQVGGVRGSSPTKSYKVSATFADGWRIGTIFFFVGEEAARKARAFAEAAVLRARAKLQANNAPDFDDVLIEVLGDESHYGAQARSTSPREVAVKIAAKHGDPKAVSLILKEETGLALATPPGLAPFSGTRPKASPVVRLFSFLVPKSDVAVLLDLGGEEITCASATGTEFDFDKIERPKIPPCEGTSKTNKLPLIRLAWGRSGDKGDNANIGIFPRDPAFVPWIWNALDENEIARRFAHFLEKPVPASVQRYFLPGTGAMNIVLENVLGGGGIASLRNDPQGKSYAQILLQAPIEVPTCLVDEMQP